MGDGGTPKRTAVSGRVGQFDELLELDELDEVEPFMFGQFLPK